MIARRSRWLPTFVATTALALGVAACGGSSSSPTTAATTATEATNASASTIPEYKPSTVVSKSPYSTVLSSPDPISKIAAFYSEVLKKDGWQVTSSSVSSYHADFSAHHANEGVSISVYLQGSGSGISISTHPA